jgi:hypothetical protein
MDSAGVTLDCFCKLCLQTDVSHVGCEVFTAVAMKGSPFDDITLCSSVKVFRVFGGINRFRF